MRLDELTWLDVTERSVLCVPVGSCEQHGPHLPLSTDTIIAEALAADLAARRPDVVVAPAMAISASGEHAGFPGTLSIGTAATARVLVELVRSADWATGVVLVNGHGGNGDALGHALRIARSEGRRLLAWSPTLIDGDAHAGRTETSLLLALRPQVVRAGELVAGVTEPVDQLAGRLRTEGVRAVSPTGVLGDPHGATAEEGRVVFERLAAQLLRAFDSWRSES